MEKYLDFVDISKAFPGVQALKDIKFHVKGGRVSALLGENGAGKSTLLKILSGDIRPDAGTILINGEDKVFSSPRDSLAAGISVIYQERQLIPMLSVAENVFLDCLPKKRIGLLDKARLWDDTEKIINKFGLPISPDDSVARLSVAHQQMVEIMKAYRRSSDIIAFDEPTAPLADAEISILFKLISQLRDEGKIILYVSHRLAEIFQVTDDIIVLKDGRLVEILKTIESNEQELVRAMVGRELGNTYEKLSRNTDFGDVVLDVRNLNTNMLKDISFSLKSGEVLGFAGLIGAGRTEVARAIFGADPILSGDIYVHGEKVCFKSPRDAIERGIGLCPEDRKDQGLVLRQSISCNISMPVLEKVADSAFMNKKKEESLANEAVGKYGIKTHSIYKIAAELSGGNQQKVILGRWTSSKLTTSILILDEPTKGIDVGTKAEIYQMVCDLAKEGKGVIYISSELIEVLNVCDNIIVMRNGKITGRVTREEATEESVLALAMLD